MSTPGERLRQARETRFETAADAAEALGMKYSTYAGHENGHRAKTGFGGNIDRYAQFFGVRGEWLRTGQGAMKPGKKPLVQELYDELPPEKQVEAIRYLKYLRAA